MGDQKTFKVVLIGDSGVGKTSLLLRFMNDEFINTTGQTTQVDTVVRPITVDGMSIKLNIWDTVGHESYDSITASYYKKAVFGVVVYDVTSEDSFQSVQNWIEDVYRYAEGNVQLAVVGNKRDLPREKQVVNATSGMAIAETHKGRFFETSAKDGTNVKTLFEEIARDILKTPKQPTPTIGVTVQPTVNSTTTGSGSKCCSR